MEIDAFSSTTKTREEVTRSALSERTCRARGSGSGKAKSKALSDYCARKSLRAVGRRRGRRAAADARGSARRAARG